MSSGMIVRIVAGSVIALSLPFLITYPSNAIAQSIFAFGNFLLIIGANLK